MSALPAPISLAAIRRSRVCCFEPDETNLPWLKRNLTAFGNRATIINQAVATTSGEIVLYRAETGKHSSLQANDIATVPQKVACSGFGDVLAEPAPDALQTVVKLDVEGLEEELIKSVRFENYPQIQRLLCEIDDMLAAHHTAASPRTAQRLYRGSQFQ